MHLMPELPDELLDKIILEIASESPRRIKLYNEIDRVLDTVEVNSELHAVSRVSRRWRRCAVPYLFRDLDVDIGINPSVQDAVTQVIVRADPHHGRNLHQFLSFLVAHPAIARCIRTLLIQQPSLSYFVPEIEAIQVMPDIEPDILTSVIRSLPSLCTLGLRDIGVIPSSHSLSRPPLSVPSLFVVTTSRPDTFITPVLDLFSCIGHLHLVSSYDQSDHSTGPGEASQASKRDASLSIDAVTFHKGAQLWPLKRAYNRCSIPLRNFTFGYNDVYQWTHLRPLHSFFVEFSGNLVSFQCNLHSGYQGISQILRLYGHLLQNLQWSRLEHLSLMAMDISRDVFRVAKRLSLWYHLPEILSYFSTFHTLRSIRLIRDRGPEQLIALTPPRGQGPAEVRSRKSYYAAVEGALLQFTSLDSVTFVLGETGGDSRDELEEQIVAESMPTLQKSGQLRFDILRASDV